MPGRLARLIRFVRLIFTPENLDDVAPPPAAPEPETAESPFLQSLLAGEALGSEPPSPSDPRPARTLFGEFFARETLPADPPPETGESSPTPRGLMGDLLVREVLPTDETIDAPGKKSFVGALLGRETLGEDPPEDPTARKPSLFRWLCTGPELGTESEGGEERAAPDATGQE